MRSYVKLHAVKDVNEVMLYDSTIITRSTVFVHTLLPCKSGLG